jgi:pimeloyl-ACP methyl ester carboxylesterase
MACLRSSDGIKLHYEVHGSGSVDVLLLHGMGDARSIWEPVLGHWNHANMRAIIPDLRGHGRSGGDGESFNYPQLQRDLLAITTDAGARKCIVVGFSGSCKNAVWFAADAPERARGLVLIAPPGMDRVPIPRETLAMFFDVLQKTGDFPAEMAGWFTEKIGKHRERIVRAFAQTPRSIFDASAEVWLHSSVVPEAARVTHPVAVIAATRDLFYPPDFQRQTTLRQLPMAGMELFDCGHFVPCEESAATADLLGRFAAALQRQKN